MQDSHPHLNWIQLKSSNLFHSQIILLFLFFVKCFGLWSNTSSVSNRHSSVQILYLLLLKDRGTLRVRVVLVSSIPCPINITFEKKAQLGYPKHYHIITTSKTWTNLICNSFAAPSLTYFNTCGNPIQFFLHSHTMLPISAQLPPFAKHLHS